MAKRDQKNKSEPLSNFQDLSKTGRQDVDDAMGEEQTSISIVSATLKDGICNYSFEIIEGVGQGATHNVKGPGIVKDALRDVFGLFNVHMAAIDNIFKYAGIEVSDIDQMHSHEPTGLYHVESFKIKGSAENERLILIGNRYVDSGGGRMGLSAPEIPLDNLSSYKWYNELRELVRRARMEVEAYNNGNYTPIEVEEEETPKYKQTSILDQAETNTVDAEFEGGPIQSRYYSLCDQCRGTYNGVRLPGTGGRIDCPFHHVACFVLPDRRTRDAAAQEQGLRLGCRPGRQHKILWQDRNDEDSHRSKRAVFDLEQWKAIDQCNVLKKLKRS